MDTPERQPQIRGVNSPIKQFSNYYHQALKDGKIPRGDLKREFYDLAKEKPWYKSEDTLDTIWTALMDHTYDPGSSTLGRKNYTRRKQIREEKKVEPTKTKTKSRKTNYIIEYRLYPLGEIQETFHSIREAAENLKLTANQVKYIISRGNHKNKFRVNLTLLHRIESEPVSGQTGIRKWDKDLHKLVDIPVSEMFAKSDPQLEPTPLVNDSADSHYMDKVFETESSEGLEQHKETNDYDKVDSARNAYINALMEYTSQKILQFGINVEKEERELLKGQIPHED